MSIDRGTRFGPYEIISAVGEGGMGEVYRARDTRLGRDVAIKILNQSRLNSPANFSRLEQEACATGSLNHPNVLAIYDVATGRELRVSAKDNLIESRLSRTE